MISQLSEVNVWKKRGKGKITSVLSSCPLSHSLSFHLTLPPPAPPDHCATLGEREVFTRLLFQDKSVYVSVILAQRSHSLKCGALEICSSQSPSSKKNPPKKHALQNKRWGKALPISI